MKARHVFGVLSALAVVTVARSGHELPVYPSYYPHEIEIAAVAPDRAAEPLQQGKLHAYIGPLRFAGAPPDAVRAIESLGSFMVVRVNPNLSDERACAVSATIMRELAAKTDGLVFHPYPVTPFHGDYLHHADLADAAKARWSGAGAAAGAADAALKLKAGGDVAKLVRPDWVARGAEWDAEILAVDAAALMDTAMLAVNGWIAPLWLKAGWSHAQRLLADALADPAAKERAHIDVHRLTTGDYNGLVERINLERDLVRTLSGCRKLVAGYTIKRQYVNVEFSAGIENISYDAIAGLHSPMFLRTVKLKDFPWNGWLALGVDGSPTAAWNPIAGMTDRFGQFMWFAVGDAAALPSPYEAGWVLNRISDVQQAPAR
jgi:hypothetical protein